MEEGELPDAKEKMGWIKIAFLNAVHFLKSDYDFHYSLKCILSQGGDTDTNGAILGGMIGAAVGFSNIPKDWIEAIRNCPAKRPEFLVPNGQIDDLIDTILQNCPQSDEDLILKKDDDSNL